MQKKLKVNNFCTLFDSNYLTRGLAMYESLRDHSNDFHLFIFAFDDRSYELLNKLNLESVTVVSLFEFEDEELLNLKKDRTSGEYCWTCTPSVIKYCIEKYGLESCTYLDADLYFFSNPSILIDEMKDKSVLITKHNYTPEYDLSQTSGFYCVQFITFKNDKNGIEVLNWWRNACNEWCYARAEDGKFGDQKYLDDWTERFEGIHELQHLGGGVAPWNIQQYKLEERNFEIVFYHFHGFKFLNDNKVLLIDGYKLRKIDISILYKPYIIHLEKIINYISKIDNSYDYHGIMTQKNDWKTPFRFIRNLLNKNSNIYTKNNILGL